MTKPRQWKRWMIMFEGELATCTYRTRPVVFAYTGEKLVRVLITEIKPKGRKKATPMMNEEYLQERRDRLARSPD